MLFTIVVYLILFIFLFDSIFFTVAVEPEKTESEKTEPEAAVNEDEPSKSEN